MAKEPFVSFCLVVVILAGLYGCGGGKGRMLREDSPATYEAKAVVHTARSQLGRAYKYGGASPATGFDCSGFTCWVYNRHNINLPRRSYDQFNAGQEVSWRDLRVGDLVFFEVYRKGASHVGIYSGNGVFIHCPSTGGSVREESLLESYWVRCYLGARRFLP
jgi:cell wall-associated NlpC family hydrolase